jgi:uncharacterized protein
MQEIAATDLSIRPAVLADAPAILAIQRRAYAAEAGLYGDWSIPPLVERLDEVEAAIGESVVLVAEHDGAVAGAVRGRIADGTCHVGRLIVEPSLQHRGIGTKLMAALEAAIDEASTVAPVGRFELFTGERSAGNLRLYERLGYRRFRTAVLTHSVTLVYLEKNRPAGRLPAWELIRFDNARAFLTAVEEYLVAHEAEHNLILGLAGALREQPDDRTAQAYFAVVARGEIQLAAIRTPNGAVLSEAVDPGAFEPLVADLAEHDPALRGVAGPAALVGAFVDRWAAATGRVARLEMRERIYCLSRVLPPARPGPGAWRFASEADRPLVAEWLVAFHREAVPTSPPPADPDAMAGRWLSGGPRSMYLWTNEGRVVCMVGASSPTPHGIRIAPVYTPPIDRGRGYASSLTAAASQDQLDAGRRHCFLFTDLANPTSNHVYRTIGYEPVTDVDQYLLVDPGVQAQ